MIKNLLTGYVVSVVLMLGFSIAGFAQAAPSITDFPNVKIGNFGQMDERFYRGAQPLVTDFQALKDLGITTVINLRNDPEPYEQAEVERLGMKYVFIPMSGWKTPKDADLVKFLSVVNDPSSGKFFVHCKAGIHRTGVAGAVYRMENYGWEYDQVFTEMKNFQFHNGFLGLQHKSLKSYVKKYAGKMDDTKAQIPTVTAATMASH